MATSRDGMPGDAPFSAGAFIKVLERITSPAYLLLPGGRIRAANHAAVRLAGVPLVGLTVRELVERYGASRADGHRLTCSDLPHTRALRGEVVNHGERLEMNLPDGSVYRALVTSMPVIVNGEVVASLSVHQDFDEYLQELEGGSAKSTSPSRQANGDRPA